MKTVFVGVTLLLIVMSWGFAQVEEIPAGRSAEQRDVEKAGLEGSKKDTLEPIPGERVEQREQMRSFVTFNVMLIIIIILIATLGLFLILRRAQRSNRT